MVGLGWQSVAKDFEHELQQADPDATVHPTVDAFGLLRLEVTSASIQPAAARAAARRWEAAAASTCEACGDSVSRVRAGPMMVVVLCSDCAPER